MGAGGGAKLRQRDAAITTEGHWNRLVGEDPIDRPRDEIVRHGHIASRDVDIPKVDDIETFKGVEVRMWRLVRP